MRLMKTKQTGIRFFTGARRRCLRAAAAAICLLCLILTGAQEVGAAPGYEDVATSSDLGSVKEVVKYGMTPISGDLVADGTYEIDVECSSSFFRIRKAYLTVEDGVMTAQLIMAGTTYPYAYAGTPEEAAQAALEDYIPLEDDGENYSFTIPVEALNAAVSCAAFSKNKEKWYPRTLCFDASSLPEGALDFDLPDYDLIEDAVELYEEMNGTDEESSQEESEEDLPTAVQTTLADGTYSIEVDMTGGSGKASVTSPTWLYIEDGGAYAKLLWSSSYYDYMIVDGTTYENETTDGGNSTFTIPITAFDEAITVIADTTAMGDPVEIEYTLTFYEESIGAVSKVPQEAAKMVVAGALVIMIVGGILNAVLKRRRKQ